MTRMALELSHFDYDVLDHFLEMILNPTSPTRADFCDFRRAFRRQAIVSNDPDRLESAVVPTKPLARRKTRRESGSCFYAIRFAAKTARCIGPGRSSRTGAPRVGA